MALFDESKRNRSYSVGKRDSDGEPVSRGNYSAEFGLAYSGGFGEAVSETVRYGGDPIIRFKLTGNVRKIV